jgi:hypothetical protein
MNAQPFDPDKLDLRIKTASFGIRSQLEQLAKSEGFETIEKWCECALLEVLAEIARKTVEVA